MPVLESDLRRQLESVIIQARDAAEAAARSAIQKRAVDVAEPFSHFGAKEKELRNRLRARGRQVGDVRNADKSQSIDQLTQELAYEFWHRMLFARFLAENHLLMHPDGVAVSLEECEELAKDANPPAPNGFVLAARYASAMLPQIFRSDDVLLEIDFAPEQRLALEKLLAILPSQTFQADDSLGWVYQFWQAKKKEEVNKSGKPIDGRTLPAVTQLFTEHYMVQFLLHNTIGAWWCGRHGIQGPPGGAGIPAGKSPVEMEYLRWRDDGTPAAGKFDGWPKTLAAFTMLDPCCGSGHFLVAAFNLLVPLRMRDEGLTAEKACEAVLRANLFGLELDPRCTQIAAFALALAAWKYPNAGGFRSLPTLNIACSGQGVTAKKEEWLALANEDEKLRNGMESLYDLFQQAPHLGSLIDPRREKGNLYESAYTDLQPLVSKALAQHAGDADLATVGVAAQGIARAAEVLSRTFTLVCTNVPYLVRGRQSELIKKYCETNFRSAKMDLATVFIERWMAPERVHTVAAVSPQNWMFLSKYKLFRANLLTNYTFNWLAKLGEGGFESSQAAGAFVGLSVISPVRPTATSTFAALDVSHLMSPSEIAAALRCTKDVELIQEAQKANVDSRIEFTPPTSNKLLSEFAISCHGISTTDFPQFGRCFWEMGHISNDWELLQSTVIENCDYGGREQVLFWEGGNGGIKRLRDLGSPVVITGSEAWGKQGVAVSQMRQLPVTLYTGQIFDDNTAVIVPKDPKWLLAIWAFCRSPQFNSTIRMFDTSLKVTYPTMVKVAFDLEYWSRVAAEEFPNSLPAPHSDDPTQWLFKGDIATSTDPLQVAVSRLLGYRWPQQSKTADSIDKLADRDGILCLPSVRGEAAAAERLHEILRVAYGKNWSDSVLHKLLTDAGCKAGTTLDDWLRNQFFEQNCKRFDNRPFIWHIWDGCKDGFSALVNYHKLDHKALENLTYSYLGDWIKTQSKSDKAGADSRLGAAQELQTKLKLILAGEPDYDIFVRWKPLHEQAIGWQPELNDGVRQNIRPFILAGVLRKEPKSLLKDKDRGNELQRDKEDYPWFWSGNDPVGDRVNDIHLTNEEKQAARSRKKGTK